MDSTSQQVLRVPPKPLVVTARDRMSMTLFVAIAFHVILIAGISFHFTEDKPTPKPQMLDITLVDSRTDKAPEKADYRAQADNVGGGNTDKRVRQASPRTMQSANPQKGNTLNTRKAAVTKPQNQGKRPVMTTTKSDFSVESRRKQQTRKPAPQVSMAEIMRRSTKIARLTAQSDEAWRAYSKRPNPRYIHANTKRYADAQYLLSWTRKVERIGNLNYPSAARRRHLSGSLLLEVVLHPSGRLKAVNVIETSGHKALDDAAIRIVRLAAPAPRIPADVLKDKNELHIINTWQFTDHNQLVGK